MRTSDNKFRHLLFTAFEMCVKETLKRLEIKSYMKAGYSYQNAKERVAYLESRKLNKINQILKNATK